MKYFLDAVWRSAFFSYLVILLIKSNATRSFESLPIVTGLVMRVSSVIVLLLAWLIMVVLSGRCPGMVVRKSKHVLKKYKGLYSIKLRKCKC